MKILLPLFVLAAITLSNINKAYAQWIIQNSGIDAMLSDVVMPDSVTAIAVGRNGSILRTSDRGETWVDITPPLSYGGFWNAITFFDPDNGIIVGDEGVAFSTNNRGRGWMWHYIPRGGKCISALGIGPGSYYVGNDSGWIYKTIDTGRTWSAEKISKWPIRSLFTWRGAIIMGMPIYALTPFSLCSKMEFPSTNWNETELPNFQALGSEGFDAEFCNGGGPGFIVGVQGDLRAAPTILRKSISDTSWNTVSAGIMRDGIFHCITAPSENTIYVGGSNGMIYKSSDGGNNWIDQSVQTQHLIKSTFFYDEKLGFAVGDSGLILFTSNGGPTNVGEGKVMSPKEFILEQNYPNPFNPITTIRYNLLKTAYVKLAVYSMLGQIVSSLVNEQKSAGTYTLQFNGSSLASGVYFYKLQSGTSSITKKFILLR